MVLIQSRLFRYFTNSCNRFYYLTHMLYAVEVVGISGAIQEVAFTLSTLCIISDGELFILPVEGSAAVRQTGL